MNSNQLRIKPPLKWLVFVCLGLFISSVPGYEKALSTSVTLIFSNDIHGVYKPYQLDHEGESRMVGGMEALSHYVRTLRAKEENMILIDTGDVMTGTLASQKVYNGVSGGAMVEFLNLLDYDIRCPGNHGFDLGLENVASSIELSDFPVILSNLIYKETRNLVAPSAYYIINKGGIRFGFIAVMEEEFFEEVKREKVSGLELLPIIPTLNSYVSKISQVTDVIVVLSHARFPTGEKIATQVPGVDVVLVAAED
jgi:2',3'-cyclic-nucleotide 2'-phosphodiesterase/3'-nucleotidase